MSKSANTHVKTNPVQIRFPKLYESKSYMDEGEEDKAQYGVLLTLDKKDDADTIATLNAGVEAAIDAAIESGEWDEEDEGRANISLRDADNDKVAISATNKRKVLLAEKRPELVGKYSISVNRKDAAGRPTVRYIDENGVIRDMPEPILDPTDPEQESEAKAVRDLWNKLVYSGQYAVVSMTFNAYSLPTGTVGVSARLDNVLIIGGGPRFNSVPFEADFDDKSIADLTEWRKRHAPGYHAPVEAAPAPKTSHEDAVETTPAETPAPEQTAPVETAPARRPRRRRRPVAAEGSSARAVVF